MTSNNRNLLCHSAEGHKSKRRCQQGRVLSEGSKKDSPLPLPASLAVNTSLQPLLLLSHSDLPVWSSMPLTLPPKGQSLGMRGPPTPAGHHPDHTCHTHPSSNEVPFGSSRMAVNLEGTLFDPTQWGSTRLR